MRSRTSSLVRAVLRAITVEGLAQYEGRPEPAPLAYHYAVPTVDPNVASSHMRFTDPLQFWEIFSAPALMITERTFSFLCHDITLPHVAVISAAPRRQAVLLYDNGGQSGRTMTACSRCKQV